MRDHLTLTKEQTDAVMAAANAVPASWRDRYLALVAVAAAPYVHPRLANVETKTEISHKPLVRVPQVIHDSEEWVRTYGPMFEKKQHGCLPRHGGI